MSVAHLSDRSVVLALQEITQELDDPADDGVTDARDAEDLLTALFEAAGQSAPNLPWEGDEAVAAGRRLLTLLTEDESTGELARSVLADPPQDDQLAVHEAVIGVVLLAGVLGWLQTKVSFRFHRDHEGRREIEFSVGKEAAPADLLRQMVQILGDRFLPPPPP